MPALQIRRYVYCDVVRATDMSPHVDVSGIQVGRAGCVGAAVCCTRAAASSNSCALPRGLPRPAQHDWTG